MFRLAILLERKEDSSLDVCVEKEGFQDKEDVKSTIPNTEKQLVRGSICFYDEREPKSIVFDFAFTYKSLQRVGEDTHGKYCFARYGKHIITTPLAFVEYFSKRTK